jgi:hypothetical protein
MLLLPAAFECLTGFLAAAWVPRVTATLSSQRRHHPLLLIFRG